MADPPDILSLRSVEYRWRGTQSFGLSVPHFRVGRSETVLLLGQSGSGKSTLLSLICGTLSAASGQIRVAGADIAKMRDAQRDLFRAEHIGLIFQQFNLLPYATVIDNVLLPLTFARERRARVSDPVAEARALCCALGLAERELSVPAAKLSVGQQQRVAAARALIGMPPLIIADEPTSALDAGTQAAFLNLLFDQVRAQKSALLMVSHDPGLRKDFDRVVEMRDIATAGIGV
ncbi:MAG: ABC transporter ATP-binding protein [Pseudomonadota bacterium]